MPTRTKNAFFKHPDIVDGTISFEDERFTVVCGVVECPLEIGEGADWRHATPEEVEAVTAPKAEVKKDKKGDK